MSAFIVTPEHIKELATYAVVKDRSVSMYVDPRYLKYHVKEETAKIFETLDITDNVQIAQTYACILYNENIRSVKHRYNDESFESLPGLIEKPEYIKIELKDLLNRRVWNPVHILKMCDCLDYQSCETDDWRQSDAYQLLLAIKEAAISTLPGYEEAPWGYSEPIISKKEVKKERA